VEREWARKLNAAQLESLQKVAEAELYAKVPPSLSHHDIRPGSTFVP